MISVVRVHAANPQRGLTEHRRGCEMASSNGLNQPPEPLICRLVRAALGEGVPHAGRGDPTVLVAGVSEGYARFVMWEIAHDRMGHKEQE